MRFNAWQAGERILRERMPGAWQDMDAAFDRYFGWNR